MVARNFSLQDLPYNHLLQVPEEEREFLTLDELKPHQLTELGVSVSCSPVQQSLVPVVSGEITNPVISTGGLLQNYHHHNVFYDIGASRSPTNANTAGNDHLTATTVSTVTVSNAVEGGELIKAMSRLIQIDSEWVPHTESASLYIRPTLIGIEPTLGVASSDSALLYTILSPVGAYFKPGSGGLKLYANPNYTRAWHGGVGDRKVGSNYGPTIHVQKEALKEGCHQVLWLYGDQHELTEVGVMNIFMLYVKENGERELLTPPLDGLILPGITRDSILRLCRQWGEFSVKEQKFTMTMVQQLAKEGRLLEMFGAGTAAVISPIEHIAYMGDEIHIPTESHQAPIYRRLYDTLTGIQYGKIEHEWAPVIA